MRKSIVAVLLAALGLSGFVASASSPTEELQDSLMSDHKIVFFGNGEDPAADSIRNVVENFYYDQFRSFQDPAAPYFLFMSRDTNLAMGIGGLVRMRGYFDW